MLNSDFLLRGCIATVIIYWYPGSGSFLCKRTMSVLFCQFILDIFLLAIAENNKSQNWFYGRNKISLIIKHSIFGHTLLVDLKEKANYNRFKSRKLPFQITSRIIQSNSEQKLLRTVKRITKARIVFRRSKNMEISARILYNLVINANPL